MAYNSFMTTKVTFANMIAEVCSRTPEADVDRITGALGMDSKVGNKLIKGSIGYGGPCWPRDNRAFLRFAQLNGYAPMLPKAVDDMNLAIPISIADAVDGMANKDKDIVVVLGLSYKPNTPLAVESQPVMLAEALAERGYNMMLHDPMVDPQSIGELGRRSNVHIAQSLDECLAKGTFFIVATPHGAYSKLSPEDFKVGSTVLDCWRSMDARFQTQDRVEYVRWGISGKRAVKRMAGND
ncbi:UDP-glucose 6-dehydrogenase [mine drainage metagenome]|uniref:UDP-glucose 6-dehydrogenase n=1 Tax=mine drainage metagenome TaxID=410659 RepID=T1CB86_9ZZZZ